MACRYCAKTLFSMKYKFLSRAQPGWCILLIADLEWGKLKRLYSLSKTILWRAGWIHNEKELARVSNWRKSVNKQPQLNTAVDLALRKNLYPFYFRRHPGERSGIHSLKTCSGSKVGVDACSSARLYESGEYRRKDKRVAYRFRLKTKDRRQRLWVRNYKNIDVRISLDKRLSSFISA